MYVTLPQQTGPSEVWEIYAILPAMIIFMVMAMLMKVVSGLMNPDYMRELKPVAESALAIKALPSGGGR